MIVYGARCVWWDDIKNAGSIPRDNGPPLPCCPHCKGVLFQMEDSEWKAGAEKYEAKNPGYLKFLEWLRGKCYSGTDEARAAYESEVTNG